MGTLVPALGLSTGAKLLVQTEETGEGTFIPALLLQVPALGGAPRGICFCGAYYRVLSLSYYTDIQDGKSLPQKMDFLSMEPMVCRLALECLGMLCVAWGWADINLLVCLKRYSVVP